MVDVWVPSYLSIKHALQNFHDFFPFIDDPFMDGISPRLTAEEYLIPSLLRRSSQVFLFQLVQAFQSEIPVLLKFSEIVMGFSTSRMGRKWMIIGYLGF